MAGRRHPATWTVAIGVQCLWILWVLLARAWGLLPATLVLLWVFAVNRRRWRHKC
jgi:hypothetical protein